MDSPLDRPSAVEAADQRIAVQATSGGDIHDRDAATFDFDEPGTVALMTSRRLSRSPENVARLPVALRILPLENVLG